MFDPYHKWLGILPKDQPPNHYRLLGVELFESDLDVIEGAADRQMAYIRQYQSGEHAAAAAKILNELANGRLCLLKPSSKAAYDAKLREAQAPSGPEFFDLPFSTDEAVEKSAAPAKTKKSATAKAAGIPQHYLIGGGVALAVVALVAMFLISSRPEAKPVEKPIERDQVATSDASKATVDARNTKEHAQTKSATKTDDVLWTDSKLGIEPASDPIDLLKLVDLKRDVDLGEWNQATSGTLINSPNSRLFFPVKPPDDYQLKFAVRRREGADTIVFGFVMSGRLGSLVLDGWNATCSGLFIDGHDPNESNCTFRRGTLLGTSTAQVVLTVHPGHLHVALDGQTIVDWHGDPSRLNLRFGELNRESPYVYISTARYVIESASLIPLKPEVELARPPRLQRDVDLISLIDVDRDMQRGIWGITKGVLYSPESRGQIYLPTVVPEEYTLSLTAELPSGQAGYALVVGLVAGKSCFQFTSTAGDTGLDGVDGLRWSQNETRLPGPLLRPGTSVRIDCTVLKDRIVIEADGKVQVDWSGDFRRLFIPGEWSLADARRLFLGNTDRHLRFKDVKLGPPSERVTSMDNPPPAPGQTIDLLPKIDPSRDAYAGTWERDGVAIRCRGDVEVNKLVIPFTVPDEYQFKMRVTRLDGGRVNNDAVAVGLPVGKGKAMCGLDGRSSTSSGITIGPGISNNRSMGQVIPLGGTKEIIYAVRNAGIQWSCDGTTIIDWKVSPEAIGVEPFWATPGRRIALMSYSNAFRFEKLELEALPPTKPPPLPTLPADGKLLPLIDPVRDARRGDWKLDAAGLVTPGIRDARLRIPVVPPLKYVFSATVERQQPGGQTMDFGLVVGGHSCLIPIDGGDNRHMAGVETVDGRRYLDGANPTQRISNTALLPQEKSVRVQCSVLPDTIIVTCDDKEVIRWHGDPRRLSLLGGAIPPNYSQRDRESLFLGSYLAVFLIRDLELRPISDAEADEILKSFSGAFPTTLQANVPLATRTPTPGTSVSASANSPSDPLKAPSGQTTAASLPPAKTGEWVDLLEWAEGVDWGPRGVDWNAYLDGKVKRTGVKFKNLDGVRFPLPAIIDGDYDLEVEFTRHAGSYDAVVFFPVRTHSLRMLLSAGNGELSELDFVDDKHGDTRRPGAFTNGQRHRVFVRVRNDGEKAELHVDFDETKDYLKWEGPLTSLTNRDRSFWKINMIRHVWIGSHLNELEFHKVRIKMLSGTIERDVITSEDRDKDLKNGFVRLVGESMRAAKANQSEFVVNQLPLAFGNLTEIRWPMITLDPKPCDDFYGAHAPSRLKCPIPPRAKSFSVVGYNERSRESKYLIYIDGKEVYDSGTTDTAIIKVEIPPKATLLELVVDPAGSTDFDHTYWCYPRFHPVPVEQVTNKMLDAKSGTLKFNVASSTAAYDLVSHNRPLHNAKSMPIHFRDLVPCDEFLFGHATSSVTYLVPEGMRRFTAIGYNTVSHEVKFEVWADEKQIFESPEAGVVPIDVKLPAGTKTIELRINDLGKSDYDDSMWCYPRLHRK